MFELKVVDRDPKAVDASKIRQSGMIPGEVYGHNQKNLHVSMSRLEFEKLFNEAGESNLVSLLIDGGKAINVLIKDVQLDPVSDQATHVDFYVVKMGEKLTTEIPLEFVGVSRAVKELGGFLVRSINSLHVSCLPKDLVSKIQVDISELSDFGKVITIGDVKIPEGIDVSLDNSVAVCLVQEPRVEKEEKLAEEEAEVSEEAKEGEEKKEGEEGKKDEAKGGEAKGGEEKGGKEKSGTKAK